MSDRPPNENMPNSHQELISYFNYKMSDTNSPEPPVPDQVRHYSENENDTSGVF